MERRKKSSDFEFEGQKRDERKPIRSKRFCKKMKGGVYNPTCQSSKNVNWIKRSMKPLFYDQVMYI
jgi:hypothetical protein